MAQTVLGALTIPSPFHDARFYTSTLSVVALALAIPLTRLNHLHTRRSSTALLVFYPLYLAAQLATLRTSLALLHGFGKEMVVVAGMCLTIAHASVLVVIWIIECFGPEMDETVDGFVNVETNGKESPYATANFYSRFVCSCYLCVVTTHLIGLFYLESGSHSLG